MPREQSHHVLILHLGKLAVELPHGEKVGRGFEADEPVAERLDHGQSLRGADRHRHHYFPRSCRPGGVDRRDHRGTRGDAVIDEDHGAARQRGLWADGAIQLPAGHFPSSGPESPVMAGTLKTRRDAGICDASDASE
ncbi:MAG: hypothetical protein RLZZ440_1483 [Planctomycetota bacterium]